MSEHASQFNAAMPEPAAVTTLLRAWSRGDEAALGELMPLVEAELRRLARVYMARERLGTPCRRPLSSPGPCCG